MRTTRSLISNLRLLGLVLCGLVLSPYSYSQEVIPEVDTVTRDGLIYHQLSTEPLTGAVVSFYDDGRLESRGTYIDGKREGLWEDFYEHGQLERRGNFKDGEHEGLWESFDEDGNLIKTEEYKDGELIE